MLGARDLGTLAGRRPAAPGYSPYADGAGRGTRWRVRDVGRRIREWGRRQGRENRGGAGAGAGAADASGTRFGWILHASYVCTFCALATSDTLGMRLLMLTAQVGSLTFNRMQAVPKMVPARWNCFFIAINAAMVGKLLHEKRPLTLNVAEAEMYARSFQKFGFTPVEFLRLVKAGEWSRHAPGDKLTERGTRNDQLMLIESGEADVYVGKRHVGRCTPSNMVGEMTFFSTSTNEACATVVASTPTVLYRWNRDRLRGILDAEPELHAKFKEMVTHDVMAKMDKDHDHVSASTASTVVGVSLAGHYVSPETRAHLEAMRHDGFDLDAAVRSAGWTADEFACGVRARQ